MRFHGIADSNACSRRPEIPERTTEFEIGSRRKKIKQNLVINKILEILQLKAGKKSNICSNIEGDQNNTFNKYV